MKNIYILVAMTSYLGISCTIRQEMHMKKVEAEEIPLTEDLMREHGVLNRLLLIYEEVIKRTDHVTFPKHALAQAVTIVQEFIENYHEKLEEDYIFPLFEKHKVEQKLVKALRTQHIRGRAITAQLKKIVTSSQELTQPQKRSVVTLIKKFITMYRPHEAREDTVLFPKVRSLLSEEDFNALGETFEKKEYELFGKEGFSTIVDRVAAIEKELGIYKLNQFTPTI